MLIELRSGTAKNEAQLAAKEAPQREAQAAQEREEAQNSIATGGAIVNKRGERKNKDISRQVSKQHSWHLESTKG